MISAPLARTSSGRIALTVAAVPTGMNAGVRISPRCMAITPVRAAPSVAEIENAKRVTRRGPSGHLDAPLGPARDRPMAVSAPDVGRAARRLRRCDRGRRRADPDAGNAL